MSNDGYAKSNDYYKNIEFDYGGLEYKKEEIAEEVLDVENGSDTDNGTIYEGNATDTKGGLLNSEGSNESTWGNSMTAEQASGKYVIAEAFEEFAEKMEAKLDYISAQISAKNEVVQNIDVEDNKPEVDTASEINKLKEEVENISSQMMKIVAYVNDLNKNISLHEKIENNLNKELEAYKKDIVAYSKKDIMEKVCEIHSDLSKELDSDVVKENDKFVKIIKYYSSYLESILRRNQVEIRKVNVGDEYDENISEVGDTVATNDESLNGKIGAVESVAYVYNSGLRNLLLKPARVKLYKYYCPCSLLQQD